MRNHVSLAVLAAVLITPTARAQTLDLTPGRLTDLRPGFASKHGEVTLGETTLKAALRMFSVELEEPMTVRRRNPGNPYPLNPETVWSVAGSEVRPRQQLELGPDRYTLAFDENDRLVSAYTDNPPHGLTQARLQQRYKGIQRVRRWHRGDQALDTWDAKLDSCVSLSARVIVATGLVEHISYAYACKTRR